jgi:hypothetical protein
MLGMRVILEPERLPAWPGRIHVCSVPGTQLVILSCGWMGVPPLDRYLDFLAVRSRPNTVLAVAYDLKVFFAVVGKPPREVTSADVLGFVTAQHAGGGLGRLQPVAEGAVGVSARTVRRRLSSVSARTVRRRLSSVSARTVRRRLSSVSGLFGFLLANSPEFCRSGRPVALRRATGLAPRGGVGRFASR